MATFEEVDLRQRADRALRSDRPREALALYGALLAKVDVYDAGRYDAWLEGELAAYERLGRSREAGYVLLALRRFAEAQRRFPGSERPLEWALAASRHGRHAEAARVLSGAGHPALAAIDLEAAGAHAAARLEWERVLHDPRLAGLPYETALARCALGQSLLRVGYREPGARELQATTRLLEALADESEGRGDVARALDCYGLILLIGRELGSFENVAEGYLNRIRIVSADETQRFLTLTLYDDFIAYAVEHGEPHSAATLAREAAAFSLKAGLVFERRYLGRASELWAETAARNEAAAGPTDLSENALHAAIEAASELGDEAACARHYEALAALPLPPAKRERYRRLAARRPTALAPPQPPAPAFPEYLRRQAAYQDVTRQDLVEWELDGDPTAVLGRLIVELGPLERVTSRLALRAVLLAVGAVPGDVRAVVELALALGRTGVYEVLRPLERLFEQGGVEVRAAVMSALAHVSNPRSLQLVRRGLADPAPPVVESALRALRALGFRSGFGALARIFRDATDERVRGASLEAIADVGTVEAGLFLLDRVREDVGAVAATAEVRLRNFPNDELVPYVRQALDVESGERRVALERIATALSGPG